MNLAEITPVILTFNEAPNIGRVLAKLTWAKDIVVDSFKVKVGYVENEKPPAIRDRHPFFR